MITTLTRATETLELWIRVETLETRSRNEAEVDKTEHGK